MLLAVSSVAAGVIHVAVVPEHLKEAWVFGVFFIIAAGLQIAWAIPVSFGPSTLAYVAGALGNGALIAIWVVSRTIGLPIGPGAWMPEPVRAPDVTATLLELLLVVGSLVLVRRRGHADKHDAGGNRLGRDPWRGPRRGP
jgi:hypothetical protein